MADRFYYAAGRPVPLDPDRERVAIDPARVKSARLARRVGAVTRSATKLPAGLLLTTRGSFSDADLAELEQTGALLRVYQVGDATAIPMPEVRIEVDGPADRAAVRAALAECSIAHQVITDDPELVVVKPVSDKSEDALDLANFVYQHARPAASAPRMVQIFARPGARTSA